MTLGQLATDALEYRPDARWGWSGLPAFASVPLARSLTMPGPRNLKVLTAHLTIVVGRLLEGV